MDKRRGVCQCCGYPTLPLRDFPQMPTFDICILCDWQDEGQSDKDADKIYGGKMWLKNWNVSTIAK